MPSLEDSSAGQPVDMFAGFHELAPEQLTQGLAVNSNGSLNGHSAPVVLSRLTDAAAAPLAIGALSLCLIVAVTALSIKVAMAMPLPA